MRSRSDRFILTAPRPSLERKTSFRLPSPLSVCVRYSVTLVAFTFPQRTVKSIILFPKGSLCFTLMSMGGISGGRIDVFKKER